MNVDTFGLNVDFSDNSDSSSDEEDEVQSEIKSTFGSKSKIAITYDSEDSEDEKIESFNFSEPKITSEHGSEEADKNKNKAKKPVQKYRASAPCMTKKKKIKIENPRSSDDSVNMTKIDIKFNKKIPDDTPEFLLSNRAKFKRKLSQTSDLLVLGKALKKIMGTSNEMVFDFSELKKKDLSPEMVQHYECLEIRQDFPNIKLTRATLENSLDTEMIKCIKDLHKDFTGHIKKTKLKPDEKLCKESRLSVKNPPCFVNMELINIILQNDVDKDDFPMFTNGYMLKNLFSKLFYKYVKTLKLRQSVNEIVFPQELKNFFENSPCLRLIVKVPSKSSVQTVTLTNLNEKRHNLMQTILINDAKRDEPILTIMFIKTHSKIKENTKEQHEKILQKEELRFIQKIKDAFKVEVASSRLAISKKISEKIMLKITLKSIIKSDRNKFISKLFETNKIIIKISFKPLELVEKELITTEEFTDTLINLSNEFKTLYMNKFQGKPSQKKIQMSSQLANTRLYTSQALTSKEIMMLNYIEYTKKSCRQFDIQFLLNINLLEIANLNETKDLADSHKILLDEKNFQIMEDECKLFMKTFNIL